MAWYNQPNSTGTASIDSLLLTQPSRIQQLFQYSQFIVQLRALNPKLSYFLRDSIYLIQQALQFITVSPLDSDSDLRKYKYPLMSLELIEVQNPAIIGCFFPEKFKPNHLLNILFEPIVNQNNQILPMLASYLQRALKCLLKLNTTQILQYVYSNPIILQSLIHHSSHKSLQFLLQAFLNVQYLKDKPTQNRLSIRLEIVELALNKFKEDVDGQRSSNLGDFLIDIIERYPMIADGKMMADLIISEHNIRWYFTKINSQTITKLLKAITNYYCMSILNTQQPQNLANAKNLILLQQQPYIRILSASIPQFIRPMLSYKYFRIVEIICHSICIRSQTILKSLIQCKFFQSVMALFFKTQSNIFHSLIQKTIAHIFYCQKSIYQQYKNHLLYTIDIFKLTAGRIQDLKLGQLMSKSYAGYLISIIKISTKGLGNSQRGIDLMQNNKQCFTKIVHGLIKTYQQITRKDMGSYQITDNFRVTEYKVSQINQMQNVKKDSNQIQSDVLKQLKTTPIKPLQKPVQYQKDPLSELSYKILSASIQQTIPQNNVKIFEQNKSSQVQIVSNFHQIDVKTFDNHQNKPKTYEDQIVIQKNQQQPQIQEQQQNTTILQKQIIPVLPPIIKSKSSIDHNPPKSFDQYMKRASKQAQQKIKLRRSSTQRNLTPVSKGLSPAKIKKSWADSSIQKNNPMKAKSPEPKLNDNIFKVKMATSPTKPSQSKTFRKVQKKDEAFLSFLGIKLTK